MTEMHPSEENENLNSAVLSSEATEKLAKNKIVVEIKDGVIQIDKSL